MPMRSSFPLAFGLALTIFFPDQAGLAGFVDPLTDRSDRRNYDYTVLYNPVGHQPTANVFEVTDGAFLPDMRSHETNVWYRNTGETLADIGDQVSVDFLLRQDPCPTGLQAVGLFLSVWLEFDIFGPAGSPQWAVLATDPSYSDARLSGSQTGFSTLTVTKTGSGTYQATVRGGGLAGEWTRTASYAGPARFGLDQYSGASSGGQKQANLRFTPACEALPAAEPSSYLAILSLAVVGLGGLVRYNVRRNKLRLASLAAPIPIRH